MGYDVHITRAAEWSDSEGTPIALDEWLAYVACDPEMRLDGFAEARTPDGEVIRIQGQGLSVWTAWPGEHGGQGHAWMDHRGECQESCRVTGGQGSRVAMPCPGLRRTVAMGDQLRVWRVHRPGRRARASR
jgi:hypothetical protein